MKFDLQSEGAFTDLATSIAAIATATGAFCSISVSIDGRPSDPDFEEVPKKSTASELDSYYARMQGEENAKSAAPKVRPEAAQAKPPEGPLFDLATVVVGEFTNMAYSIAGFIAKQNEEQAVEQAVKAAIHDGVVKGVSDALNCNGENVVRNTTTREGYDPHVSTRGFRRGDRVVDDNGDYATVVGTPNGHTEVIFDGMRQTSVMVGVMQDLLEKVPDQKMMEEPASSPWKYQLGSSVVLETSREAYAERKKQAEIDAKLKDRTAEFHELATIGIFHGPVEEGHVTARAHHSNGLVKYEVRYRTGCGSQVDAWLDEDAICQPWNEEVAETPADD